MAGDWQKVEDHTPDKPEILRIAARTGLDPEVVFTKCFKLWRWAAKNTVDGVLRFCDAQALQATLDHFDASLFHRPGFSHALSEEGWLQVRSCSLVIPNFDRHMSQTAKKKVLASRRMACHRARKRAGPSDAESDGDVTPGASPEIGSPHIDTHSSLNSSSKKKNAEPKKRSIFVKPTVEEVRAYCLERGNGVDAHRWMDHYQSNGWRVGKNAMSDWKAAVRTWEKNAGQFGNSPEVDSDKARKRKEAWDRIGTEDEK